MMRCFKGLLFLLGLFIAARGDTLAYKYVQVRSASDTLPHDPVYTIGDLNGDGFLDIVEGTNSKDNSQSGLNFYINDKHNNFTKTFFLITRSTFNTDRIVGADLDNDGQQDIIHLDCQLSTLRYLRNKGNLNYSVSEIYSDSKMWAITSDFVLWDINRDGFLDIVASQTSPKAMVWFENQDGLSFKPPQVLQGLPVGRCFQFIDVDNDSMGEFVTNTDTSTITWFKPVSDTVWSRYKDFTPSSVKSFQIADADGNGAKDFLIPNFFSGVGNLFLNDGSSHFTEKTIITSPPITGEMLNNGLTSVDIDCDGNLDILPQFYCRSLITWLQNVSGQAYKVREIPIGSDCTSTQYCLDLDQDGDLDFVVGDSRRILGYISNITPEFTDSTKEFVSGVPCTLSWNGAYKGTINVEYRLSGGNWQTVATNKSAVGSLIWTIPSGITSVGDIRIIDGENRRLRKIRQVYFVKGNLTLLTPSARQVVRCNDTAVVTWSTLGVVPTVNLDFSIDGGTSWNSVAKNQKNTDSFQWKVPDQVSDSCKLRISSADDSSVATMTAGYFSTRRKSTITLLKPIGGETYQEGKLLSVAWKTYGPIDSIRILWSLDSGVTWRQLTRSTPNDGGYVFPISAGVNSPGCLIKVYDIKDSSISDQCDSIFRILPSGAIARPLAEISSETVWILCPNGPDGTLRLFITLPKPNDVSVGVYSLSGRLVGGYKTNFISSGSHLINLMYAKSSSLLIVKVIIGNKCTIQKCFVP